VLAQYPKVPEPMRDHLMGELEAVLELISQAVRSARRQTSMAIHARFFAQLDDRLSGLLLCSACSAYRLMVGSDAPRGPDVWLSRSANSSCLSAQAERRQTDR
jgi:hypothetical protein